MTVRELSTALTLTALTGENSLDLPVEGCYIGDLLSWVMGRAQEGNAWVTVMGNINAIAVAKLAEISCIILCENAHLDADAKAQAIANNIAIFSAQEPAYELAVKISKLL